MPRRANRPARADGIRRKRPGKRVADPCRGAANSRSRSDTVPALVRIRTSVLLAAVVVAGVAAASIPARAVVASADVTIRARAFFDPGSASPKVELSGTIGGTGSGEVVEVEARECGTVSQYFRVIGADRAAAGGSWRYVAGLDQRVSLPAYFRARWRNERSAAVLVKVSLDGGISMRRRVVHAYFSTSSSGLNLHRRWAELQREVPGTEQWVRVRRARLALLRGYWFGVRFRVATRGLNLRVLLPAATVGPCYTHGITEAIRS
jgi:hypothetical protein